MKIALAYHDLSVGGGTYQLLSFAQELAKKHEVTIFASSDSTNNHFSLLKKNINFRIVDKKILRNNSKLAELFMPFIQMFRLAKLILKEDFDIINSYDVFTHWPAVIVKFIKKTPVVWTCFDLWHVPGMEETLEKRLTFRIFNRTVRWWTDLFFTRNVDSIIVLDNKVKEKIKMNYHCNSIVIRSGYDAQRFKNIIKQDQAKEKLNLKKRFIFLCFSIFNPHRRFEDAITAFKNISTKYNNASLAIIGTDKFNPEYADSIKKLVVDNRLEKRIIIDTKFLPEPALQTYLSASDVFVYPNERQTWGLSVIEEMSLGKPCIVSDQCGVSEIIQSGKNGFVYNCRNIKQLQKMMEKLYFDANLRRKVGSEAKKFVLTNLSWKNHTQEMLGIFEQLIKK